MREIKFRGMGLGGEWHYGHLSCLPKPYEGRKSGYYISNAMGMPWAYPVRPETLGQYIGLQDLKGVDIYEGDILQYDDGTGLKCEVVYFPKNAEYGMKEIDPSQDDEIMLYYEAIGEIMSILDELPEIVIGNIHEKEVEDENVGSSK